MPPNGETNNVTSDSRPVVSPDGAAEYLGIHRESVYRLIARGQLRATKIGSHWRIRRADLDALLSGETR